MMFLKHKKHKKTLLEIDKGMASIASVLQNLVQMQGTMNNGKLKIAT